MQKSRNLSIDLVKIVAMFGVMCLHSTHSYSIPGQLCFADILYESAVVSMPLFFMVSGYLLIGREKTDYRYAFRKVIGIIRFVSIIVFTFWLARSVYHLQFDFVELFKSLVYPYIQRGQFGVFWYFGAMIILYLLYPAINTLYECHRHAYYALLSTTLLASYTMFISNLLWGGVFDTCENEPTICQTFRIWISISYFMIGGLIYKLQNPKYSVFFIITLFILNIVIEEWLCRYIGNEYVNISTVLFMSNFSVYLYSFTYSI